MTCDRCDQTLDPRRAIGIDQAARATNEPTREFLDKSFYHNLCPDCVPVITRLVGQAEKQKMSAPRNSLKEHIHYTLEEGNYVFTELYHVIKGYCCQNGCRHCPYGFRSVMSAE